LIEWEFEGSKDKENTKIGRPILHAMPKGVINLENLFDLQDKFKIPLNVKIGSSSLTYEVINLGTVENPRNINLGK